MEHGKLGRKWGCKRRELTAVTSLSSLLAMSLLLLMMRLPVNPFPAKTATLRTNSRMLMMHRCDGAGLATRIVFTGTVYSTVHVAS